MAAARQHAAGRSSWAGPALLFLGAGVLLYRTIALLKGGARTVLKTWVVCLTLAEMAIDLATMMGAARWLKSRDPRHAHVALRAGAAATFLHAARVLIFVLGRTGPWFDLDVRPEQRADHRERWKWSEVVFAGVLSVLGVLGAVFTWRARRMARESAS